MKEKSPVKQLTVYKASAGSGKTFTLAVEYIKLLIDNPRAYENILAVTFTNKATEEMKTRILSQLYGIAHHLSDSRGYLEKICSEMHISEEYAAERANEALYLLLHNYNFFHVETIDCFFQGIMRNLARELSLSNNLRISLNDNQVIGNAVDSLMENLTSDKELMRWIEEYVNESMDEGSKWNITDDVKEFGKNISKEFYKSNRKRLSTVFEDPHFFDDYKRQLSEISGNIEKKYRKEGIKALNTLEQNNLTVNDFSSNTRGVMGYFIKLSNGIFDNSIANATALKAMEDPYRWVAGAKKKDADLIKLIDTTLRPLLISIESQRSRDYHLYNSAKKTLQNINKLRLLHSIEEEVRRENGKHSRFMLSNTQTLLHEMIEGDENVISFIYEKIGTRITHIMIDEFQDTSRIQWKNFKVLLEEAMSQPKFHEDEERTMSNNLIVGDVKQSIYRFRSGDWRLLNGIEGEFKPSSTKIQPLSTNYRSERNIIDFNNIFFSTAVDIEANRIDDGTPETPIYKKQWAEQLRRAYDDVKQDVPANREKHGWVKVKLIPGSKGDTQEDVLDYVYRNICLLTDEGARLSDIAILVRNNREIPVIAEYLSTRDESLKIVSEEAFRLDASPAVNILVNAMKLLANKDNIQAKATLIELYHKYMASADTPVDDKTILTNMSEFYALLPNDFTDENKQYTLMSYSLNELAEHLFRIFNIGVIEGQSIYISTFYDKLNDYVKDNAAILEKFLEAWDDEICKKTISVGNINGIRILSMHKSKGLEFDHVIIPNSNWMLESTQFTTTLWCETKEEPFNRLPFIPINYKREKDLANSIYEYNGSEEAMLNIVDNLNLLYVDFTRASKSLIVVADINISGGKEKEDGRAALIAKTLRKISEEKLLDDVSFTDIAEGEPLEFTFGEIYCKEEKEKSSDNIFIAKPDKIEISIESHANKAVQFRQSNDSRDFSEDFTDETDKKRFIRNGTILHQLFSKIRTIDDIGTTISEMEFSGVLYNEDMTADKLREEIKQRLSSPEVKEWFAPHWRVYNECCILYKSDDGKVVEERPDRVITDGEKTIVIDYKFGKPNEDYKDQVRRYMHRLQQIGHKNIQGYLWYVVENKIVPVS